jgi:hypothetical protein
LAPSLPSIGGDGTLAVRHLKEDILSLQPRSVHRGRPSRGRGGPRSGACSDKLLQVCAPVATWSSPRSDSSQEPAEPTRPREASSCLLRRKPRRSGKRGKHKEGRRARPMELSAKHNCGQRAVAEKCARNRDYVCRPKTANRLKSENQKHHASCHHCVDLGYVNGLFAGRSVTYRHAGSRLSWMHCRAME